MAAEGEKAKKASEQPPAEGEGQEKKKRFNLKTILLVGGMVLFNAVFVVVVLWCFRTAKETPATAQGSEQAEPVAPVEMSVVPGDKEGRLKAVNARSGRLMYWSLKVHLRVPAELQEHVQKRLGENENLIKQEITTLVSASDPEVLQQEADKATLRRQIKFALSKILGKGSIEDVVISECIPQPME